MGRCWGGGGSNGDLGDEDDVPSMGTAGDGSLNDLVVDTANQIVGAIIQ